MIWYEEQETSPPPNSQRIVRIITAVLLRAGNNSLDLRNYRFHCLLFPLYYAAAKLSLKLTRPTHLAQRQFFSFPFICPISLPILFLLLSTNSSLSLFKHPKHSSCTVSLYDIFSILVKAKLSRFTLSREVEPAPIQLSLSTRYHRGNSIYSKHLHLKTDINLHTRCNSQHQS